VCPVCGPKLLKSARRCDDAQSRNDQHRVRGSGRKDPRGHSWPIGATEAHGPHLPLGTDAFQPEAIADAVAERVNGLVAPAIKYGQIPRPATCPETIGITSSTLRSLIVRYPGVTAPERHPQDRDSRGHSGSVHHGDDKDACEDVVRRYQMDVIFLADYDIGKASQEEIDAGPDDGHGG